jgi:hypothetical protein
MRLTTWLSTVATKVKEQYSWTSKNVRHGRKRVRMPQEDPGVAAGLRARAHKANESQGNV